MMKYLLAGLTFLFAKNAWACPFCETGGKETALFILTILGLFGIAAGIVLVAFYRSGAFRRDGGAEFHVLHAEGWRKEAQDE